MSVLLSDSEVKARMSNIGECQHALGLLSENERETYFKDMFECCKVMLGEYKALLSDMNKNANEMYCENCSQEQFLKCGESGTGELRFCDAFDKNEIPNALMVIQNDLLSCENAMDLGKKYANYENVLKSFFLKGNDELVKKQEDNNT